jgi:predicted Zn-dependent protease
MIAGAALRGLVAALALAAVAACSQSLDDDTLVPLMSLREEEEVGRLQHPRMLAAFGGAYDDSALDRYVGEVTVRLIERSNSAQAVRRVTVLNSPSVNAFALPGGYIYVTRGLLALAGDEAELATVIAHEIGHVEARHPAKRIARTASAEVLGTVFGRLIAGDQAAQVASLGSEGYIAQYSRRQELEADALGIKAAAAADYDPRAALSFLSAMERDQALNTELLRRGEDGAESDYMQAHPPTPQRIAEARGVVSALPPAGERRREIYLGRLDGMTFGDAPENGIVRGREFLHPVLRFRFEVPVGFTIHNRPSAVVALGENRDLILFDRAEMSPEVLLSDYLQKDWAAALPIRSIDSFRSNGVEAATAYAPLGNRDVRLVILRDEESVYRFIVLATPGSLVEFAGPMRDLAMSFRRLSAAEARRVRPLRLVVRAVRGGETAESLSRNLPFSSHRLERFRVLNNLAPDETLRPGQLVKLISD